MRTSSMRRPGPIFLFVFSLLCAGDAAAQGVFASAERHSANVALFPKWGAALGRTGERDRCPEACQRAVWRHLLTGLFGRTPDDQIRLVNGALNRLPYVSDAENYGVEDHWASPMEFLRRGGDCEDYAIAKYAALRALGFPAAALRVVVLNDAARRARHAVLLVVSDGRTWLLDNRAAQPVPAETALSYRPIFSINEGGWWLHG